MEWTQAAPGSIASSLPEDAEIVANLWYVIDHQGFIFSLRVLSYVATGTDQEKIAFLTSRAYLDYLVARPFPIPERYGTIFIGDNGEEIKYAVIHHDSLGAIGGADQLFFDALDIVQSDLPAQTKLHIPENPLIKVTALHGNSDGTVIPVDALSRGAV